MPSSAEEFQTWATCRLAAGLTSVKMGWKREMPVVGVAGRGPEKEAKFAYAKPVKIKRI